MLIVDPARLSSMVNQSTSQDSAELLKTLYRPTIVDKQLTKLDADIASTLNSDLPEDVKAKQYEMVLRGYRYYEPKVTAQRPADVFGRKEKKREEDGIIESTPAELKPKAKRLLKEIKPLLRWSDDNEILSLDQSGIVPHSDIGELLATAVDKKKKRRPPGYNDFAETLKEANLPRELIPNDYLWNYMHPKPKKGKQRKQVEDLFSHSWSTNEHEHA